MPISDYAGNNVLNSLLRGVTFPLPTHVYISLHTADPVRTGANEVTIATWPSYIRKAADAGGAVGTGFTAAAARASSNAIQLLWPVSNAAGNVTVTHWGIWDALTAGNFLGGGTLTSSRTIQPGDVFVADVNKLTANIS